MGLRSPQDEEQLTVLYLVVESPSAAEVPYAVAGSAPMTAYAPPRRTGDVDIVAQVAPADAQPLCGLVQPDF